MAARLAENLKFTANDINGDPWVGAKLYSYETGTTNPKTTWVDSVKSAPNANPMVLDSYGQATVFIDSTDGAYRFRLVSPGGVIIWTVDNVKAPLELLDEDAMTSNSASAVPSQQSTKAYVDALRTDMGNLIDQDLREAATPNFAGLTIGNVALGTAIFFNANQNLATTSSPAFAGCSVGGSPVLTQANYTPDNVVALEASTSVTVGSGGTYATITAALQALVDTYYPTYRTGGIRATINLLTGFIMAEQIIANGIDLSWITIVGVDAETVINRSSLTLAVNESRIPAFGAVNGGKSPLINQLFSMNTTGTATGRDGFFAHGAGSVINVASGAGVKNAGGYGLHAYNGAVINAAGAICSGAASNGALAINGATINAPSSTLTDAGINGAGAYNGSTLNLTSADVSGATSAGIFAEGASRVNAMNCDATGAGQYGVFSSKGAMVNIYGGSAKKGVDESNYDVVVAYGGMAIAHAAGGLSITANTMNPNGIIWA